MPEAHGKLRYGGDEEKEGELICAMEETKTVEYKDGSEG
jgi:hypothetical protein